MSKFKIILIGTIISSFSFNTLALDLQSRVRNTDRSLMETISDYQTIEPGRFYFSNTASLISNPLVDNKTGTPIIESLTDMEFSVVGSFMKNWEIGISVPYIKTENSIGSRLNGYSGLSDVYIENKFNLFEQLSVIPVYILSASNGSTGAGSAEGGYGLRIVGSFFERSLLPFYYSIGYYSLPNNMYGEFDQSSRINASLGSLYHITKEIVAGTEFYIDQSKNKVSKELLAHLTIHTNSFSIRAGVGSGFLNEHKMNDLRVFTTLMFDVDFRSKNEVAIYEVRKTQVKYEEEKIEDKIMKVEPKIEEVKEEEQKENKDESELDKKLKQIEELQKKINKVSYNYVVLGLVASLDGIDETLLTDNSLSSSDVSEDDYTVLPAFTVKDLKEMKRKKEVVAAEPLMEELSFKNDRLKLAQDSLLYFVEEYQAGRITDEEAKKELSWGLRVVNRRKNTLKDLYSKNQEFMERVSEGLYFQAISPQEIDAKSILKNKNKKVEMVEKLGVNPEVKKVKTVSLNESNEEREARLEAEQKKLWEISKTQTLFDTKKTNKKKENKGEYIKTPNTSLELSEKSSVIIQENIEVENKDSFAKNEKKDSKPETTIVIEQKTKEEKVIVSKEEKNEKLVEKTAEVVSGVITTSDIKAEVLNEEKMKAVQAENGNKIVVIPEIESLVSENIDIKQTNKNTEEVISRINFLIEKKKEEKTQEEIKYKSLYDYYENEINNIKNKITAGKKEQVGLEPKKKVEIIIENRTMPTFHQDGTIEIKQFKLNSIKERFQEDIMENKEFYEETVPKKNFSGGLVEEGELEVSDGPIY